MTVEHRVTMHEQTKINEAKYFLAQMMANADDRLSFNYSLSAFLAAARSALQYALKEAKAKPSGQAWYDTLVAGKTVVKFLKDKRNINIHANPISPSANIGVSVTDTVHISASVSVTILRKDGSIEEEKLIEPSPPPPRLEETESSVTYEYFFPDWSGDEDVITLCQSYINDVQVIISNGVASGFLTP